MQDSNSTRSEASTTTMSTAWMRVLIVLLAVEKVIQHIAVTLAFVFDVGDIRAGMALDFHFFMVAGAVEALLFAIGAWGIIQAKPWAKRLLLALALFDIVGEFVAQGTLLITINVSILVAITLLCVSMAYRQAQR